MKPLAEIDNAEKAYYLHCWFPQYMPAIIQYFENMSWDMDGEDIHRQPTIPGIPFIELNGIWQEIKKIIEEEKEIVTDARLFAEKLFGGKIGVVNIFCLISLTELISYEDPKFTQAVNFLFS